MEEQDDCLYEKEDVIFFCVCSCVSSITITLVICVYVMYFRENAITRRLMAARETSNVHPSPLALGSSQWSMRAVSSVENVSPASREIVQPDDGPVYENLAAFWYVENVIIS